MWNKLIFWINSSLDIWISKYEILRILVIVLYNISKERRDKIIFEYQVNSISRRNHLNIYQSLTIYKGFKYL